MYSAAICFYLHYLIMCSAHSLPHSKYLLSLTFCGQKLSHNCGSIAGFRKAQMCPPTARHPDVWNSAAEEAAKQMNIFSLPSLLPFKMTAAVPRVPAHLGHLHIPSCDSSLQLPGPPFCFHQINTLGNRPSQTDFTAQLPTASSGAAQTPIRLNDLQC